jgi:hypothetical protein
LEETNKNTVTSDQFYKTAEGMEGLVNSCYAPTRIWYGKVIGHLLTEAGTDEMLPVDLLDIPISMIIALLYKQQKRAFYLFGKAFIEVSMLVIQHWNIFRHRLFQLVRKPFVRVKSDFLELLLLSFDRDIWRYSA